MRLVLRDGRQVEVRPLGANDGERLRRLFFRLSPLSVYHRFLSPLQRPSEDGLRRLLDVDHCDREALAALYEDEIVAVARYGRQPGAEVADIAVVVADDWQRDGLALLLLERLALVARLRGIGRFQATVLGENAAALRLVRRVFPASHSHWEAGLAEFDIPLSPPPSVSASRAGSSSP